MNQVIYRQNFTEIQKRVDGLLHTLAAAVDLLVLLSFYSWNMKVLLFDAGEQILNICVVVCSKMICKIYSTVSSGIS